MGYKPIFDKTEKNNPPKKTKESEFFVIKKNYTYRECSYCEGKGKTTRVFRKMKFVEDCKICKGKGKQKFTTTEEYPLLDAIKELSIIK